MKNNEIDWKLDNSYLNLPQKLYSIINPTIVKDPSCVIVNNALAGELGLDLTSMDNKELANILSGNILPNMAQPIAQAYAGHQFGYFNILGDGRAILLGEHITPDNKRYDIQLKGSGQTPYSRRGDGKAALGPMLREYIISEAMHALNIPTTRSLAVIATGEEIRRESSLPGAILVRIAASHIRVGTFEYASFLQDDVSLKSLADYTIKRHYPEAFNAGNPYIAFLELVIDKQASLIAKWMSVGFIHGVMNTDNMAISGETIDYGPCAFMDKYDIDTVFSSIDRNGRYAYGKQAQIAKWNLARFAETLLPLLHPDKEYAIRLATDLINQFDEKFNSYYQSIMRKKLGLLNSEDTDIEIINDLFAWMQNVGADYTNTFRDLASELKISAEIYQDENFRKWYLKWQQRLRGNNKDFSEAIKLMNSINPYLIPRNYLVEEALLKAHQGDLSNMERLLAALKNPFTQNDQYQDLAETPTLSTENYKTFCGT